MANGSGRRANMVRRLVHALVIVLTLVIGAAAAAIIVSQTAWFKNWLRGYIVREANQYLNGTLTIERLGGNLFFGIEMENVGVSLDGEQMVAVKDLGLDYNVFELVSRGLSVDNIRLDQPIIYLRREGDTWSLSRLVKKQAQEADRRGPEKPISIDAIDITGGSLVVDDPVGTSGVEVPKRFDHLDAKLSFKYEPVRYSIEITQVSFRGSDPAIALNALSGGVAVRAGPRLGQASRSGADSQEPGAEERHHGRRAFQSSSRIVLERQLAARHARLPLAASGRGRLRGWSP